MNLREQESERESVRVRQPPYVYLNPKRVSIQISNPLKKEIVVKKIGDGINIFAQNELPNHFS